MRRYTSAAYRELGQMLRQTRETAGLSETQLARRLGWSLPRVSRMENGLRTSTTTEVIQYAVMCGMKVPAAQPLLQFTRLCEQKQGYYLSDERIDGSLQSLIFHESSARHSIIYEPHAIHGLLQTRAYARAHITAVDVGASADVVEGVVRTRMERRQVLYREHPARFTFYLPEQALRLHVGANEVMHEQLLDLVLTAALDNVTIRIVPAAAGAFGDAFRLMEFDAHPPIVYLDNFRIGGLILEGPDYVNSYRELGPMLADAAMDEGQSREFAANLADEYDRGSQRGVPDLLAQEQLQPRIGDGLRGGGVAEEQLQPRHGDRLCGSDVADEPPRPWVPVAEPPTPIYE